MKATVSGVVEDLNFKISECSDPNWCFPDSAQLAVSAVLNYSRNCSLHATLIPNLVKTLNVHICIGVEYKTISYLSYFSLNYDNIEKLPTALTFELLTKFLSLDSMYHFPNRNSTAKLTSISDTSK